MREPEDDPFDPNATELLEVQDQGAAPAAPTAGGPAGPFDPAETIPYPAPASPTPSAAQLPSFPPTAAVTPEASPRGDAAPGAASPPPAPPPSAEPAGRPTRRSLLGGGLLAAALATAGGWRAVMSAEANEATLSVTRLPESSVRSDPAGGATPEDTTGALSPGPATHDEPTEATSRPTRARGPASPTSSGALATDRVRLTLGTMKDVSASGVPAMAQALRASLRRQLQKEPGLTLTRDAPRYALSAVLRTLTFGPARSAGTTVVVECSAMLSRAGGGGLRFSTSARATLEAGKLLRGSARTAAAVEALDECAGSLGEDVSTYLRSKGRNSR